MSKQKSKDSQPYSKGGSHAVKRRLRFDRIAVVVIPMLLIILLIGGLCFHSCSKRQDTQQTNNSANTPAATEPAANVATGSTEKEKESTPAAETTASAAETTASVSETVTTAAAVSGDSTQITLAAKGVHKGDLILINGEHSCTFPNGDPKLLYVHEERNNSYSVSDNEMQLEKDTISHLNDMMEAFETETGLTGMQVFSGYRDKADQDERYESGSSTFRGGYSDYHSGRSFNLKINFGDGTSDYYNPEKYPEYSWISEHAAEYGFIVRFPDGKDEITGEEARPYTFRYVGIPHASYITQNKLCLEEYVEKIHSYSVEDPLEITVGESTYAVFYVPIGGTKDVDITIPSSNYTASGDNLSGYIVSCQSQ